MSWSKIFAVGAICCAVSACGFRPLYAPPLEDANGVGVYAFDVLRSVEIAAIPDREGQYLHNKLSRLLQPQGRSSETNFILNVSLSEGTTSLAVRKSALATRANLLVHGSFSLTPVGARSIEAGNTPSKSSFSGSASVTSGYNLFESEFQTLSAKKGARERALDDLAQQIRTQVAAFLTSAYTLPARP